MRIKQIFLILFLGIALGYAARAIKNAILPPEKPFDASNHLLDEAAPPG